MPAEAGPRGAAAPSVLEEVGFLPLPDLALGSAARLVAEASAHLAVPCRLLTTPRLVSATIPGRDQIDADRLLLEVEALAQPAGPALVAVTSRDVAIPIFTFVFGRARVGGRAAVVSLARLQPEFYGLPADPGLALRRAVAEVLHELGHVGGLGHCNDYQCLMHFSNSVEAVDQRGLEYCRECRRALGPVGLVAGE
ncbi:MAG: archemetzincin [Acidobacteriota bacterium]